MEKSDEHRHTKTTLLLRLKFRILYEKVLYSARVDFGARSVGSCRRSGD